MTVLYITSDQPQAGKTALAGALIRHLSGSGKKVGYIKPLSPDPQNDADMMFLSQVTLAGGPDRDGFMPTLLTEEPGGQAPSLQDVGEKLRAEVAAVATDKEWVLVEGPSLSGTVDEGSSLSPGLAEIVDAQVVLIIRYRANLNPQLVVKACELFGPRLAGVVVNGVTRYKKREISSTLKAATESKGINFLGIIPEDRLMLSATVGQIADHIGGRWLSGQDQAQCLVEHILIGGNIMDSGASYFGRLENKAVVVRADRPDIQLSALATSTSCLILTGGYEVNQYVQHEAERQDVPVLLVSGDTLSTSDLLATIPECHTSQHPRKLERFEELVHKHTSIGVLLGNG